MQDLRIALVICNAPVGEVDRNLETMKRRVAEAASTGAGLVCFPELNVTGYCNRPRLARCAQTAPGPVTDAVLDLAARRDITILFGMAEKDAGGKLFASHMVASPDGGLGVYRKLHIAPPERATFQAGDRVPLFSARGLRFGIQLCYDAHFPGLSTRMAADGAEVIFVPHASPRGDAAEKHRSWMRHLPARAYDNGVYVAACNQAGENCNGLAFPGNAVILGPSGTVIAAHLAESEAVLYADLEAAELERVRGHEMRYFFPNRRPEIYSG